MEIGLSLKYVDKESSKIQCSRHNVNDIDNKVQSVSSLEELNKFKPNSHIVQDVSLPHIQCGEGQSTLGLAGITEVIELKLDFPRG